MTSQHAMLNLCGGILGIVVTKSPVQGEQTHLENQCETSGEHAKAWNSSYKLQCMVACQYYNCIFLSGPSTFTISERYP